MISPHFSAIESYSQLCVVRKTTPFHVQLDIKMLEICIDSLESAKNAIKGGARRLELCSSLSEGGLTPTYGLAKLIKSISKIPVFVMIRIRGGDFVYERQEMDAMLDDIETLKKTEVDGFVFGALTTSNEIHKDFCREVIKAAQPQPVTFHRAFDEVTDPCRSLHILNDLGFRRVLTSGQQRSAFEGLGLIRKLVEMTKMMNIIIMPGAGISDKNILAIKEGSEAKEFHASARKLKTKDGSIKYNIDHGPVYVADEETVRSMWEILQKNM